MDIKNEQFVSYLRSALHHLYDPDHLRRSPLVAIFGLEDRVDTPSALQKILLTAVEDLQPGDDEPPQSRAWLMYDVLFFRYVRGYEREAVANQLGISDRQLSREQRAAIETLSIHLWEKFQPKAVQELDQPAAENEAQATQWGEPFPNEKPAPWKSTLASVLELAQPLAEKYDVTVHDDTQPGLPDLVVPQVALRHSLLSVLGLAVTVAAGGVLHLAARIKERELHLMVFAEEITGSSGAILDSIAKTSHRNLDAARQLLERAGGQLTTAAGPNRLEVTILLPALEQVPVLVVDDNADSLQLFARYAQGTRYAVTGIQDSTAALQLAESLSPRIILLDVMMPEIDGWELLSRIRQVYKAGEVAIVVCSILPQEGLAQALGADAFLQKPVLPKDFIHLLDQQFAKTVRSGCGRRSTRKLVMNQWIRMYSLGTAHASSTFKEILISNSRYIIVISVFFLIASAIIVSGFSPTELMSILLLISLVFGLLSYLAYRLIERYYTLTHIVWQIGLLAVIVSAALALQRPEVLLLLALLPLVVTITLGWFFGLLAELVIVVVIAWTSQQAGALALSPFYAFHGTGSGRIRWFVGLVGNHQPDYPGGMVILQLQPGQ
jgi:CheY-like chemotaxis protein